MAKAFKSTQSVLTTLLTTAIVHAAFIYIWEKTGQSLLVVQLFQHSREKQFFFVILNVQKPNTCGYPSTRRCLTSTVGQSVHGVAFVAKTLKTTRGVHTRVITCPLKKTLIYICNQNKADDLIAGQSVVMFIRRDFPLHRQHFAFDPACTVCFAEALIVITGKKEGSDSLRLLQFNCGCSRSKG